MAWRQNLFRYRLVIDERAVRRLKVSHQHAGFTHLDFAMKTGNGRLRDAKIIGWIAADGVETSPQIQILGLSDSSKDVANHGRFI